MSSADAATDSHGEGGGHGRRLTIMIVASIVLAILSAIVIPPIMYTDADRAEAEKLEQQIWEKEQKVSGLELQIEALANPEVPPEDPAVLKRQEVDIKELRDKIKKLEAEIAELREQQPSEESTVALFEAIGIGGEVFLRALTMMVVPLVVASVMSGILGMGDVRKLGRPGLTAILYYVSTTVLAVVVGLVVVNVLKPGDHVKSPDQVFVDLDADKDDLLDLDEFLTGVDQYEQTKGKRQFKNRDTSKNGYLSLDEYKEKTGDVADADRRKLLGSLSRESRLESTKIQKLLPHLADPKDNQEEADDEGPSLGTIFSNLLLMLFTDNLFAAAAETQLLPLIVFSIIFAGMLTTLGSKVDDMTEMISEANTALMSFVMLLMNLAPIGIFCLVASRFGEAQAKGEFIETLSQTGWFVLTVLIGLGAHLFGTLPLLYWVFKKQNPYRFMKNMSRALLTAFSTASSSATLPVTMECATKQGGVSKRSVDFVLPLGATINMDGTALYEAAAAIFIAQIYAMSPEGLAADFNLGFANMLIIAVTATLAAIGAAGIPEAGLVTMMIVLNAVGLPLEYVSLILSVDWLLDRFRTATNTFGDAVGAAIVDETFDDS